MRSSGTSASTALTRAGRRYTRWYGLVPRLPQPRRAEVLNRREAGSPTGTVGQSDFPLTDLSHRR